MNNEIILFIIKLTLGGIAAFLAIFVMSKTRDASWMFLVAGFLFSYAAMVIELMAELPLRQEKDWFIYDTILTKYWERKGPYLYPKITENKYDDFVKHCLDCSIVINPSYNEPSIIPFGADKGVFTKLKNNPFEEK